MIILNAYKIIQPQNKKVEAVMTAWYHGFNADMTFLVVWTVSQLMNVLMSHLMNTDWQQAFGTPDLYHGYCQLHNAAREVEQ